MRVRELMTPGPVTLAPDDRLTDAEELMGLRGFRHIPVIDESGLLVGIISHIDLVRAALEGDDGDHRAQLLRKARIRVVDLMATPVDTVGPDDEVGVIAKRLRARRRACFPVVEDGKLVGILTEADFVRLVSLLLDVDEDPAWLDSLRERMAMGEAG